MQIVKKLVPVFLLISILLVYYQLAHTHREHTLKLISLTVTVSFFLWVCIRQFNSLILIFLIGIICRFFFFFEFPLLSQDFYRFLWDGSLQGIGINPYLYTPDALKEIVFFPQSETLFQGMGTLSNVNYSNYPPLSQFLYSIAAFLIDDSLFKSVTFIRSIYMLGDVFLFFSGISLLKKMHIPSVHIAWYFLNPLIIIEGIGNLHAEGFMLSFTLLSWLFLHDKKVWMAGFFTALAVAIKLLPLLFIAPFYRYLGYKKFVIYGISFAIMSIILWFPYWNGEMGIHYRDTLFLWFNTFEFNGSLYNIVRSIGYEVKGFNIIKKLGKITPYIVFGLVLAFSLIRSNRTEKSVFKSLLLILSCYFFMATTLHPWYLIFLVFLGIITGYAFPILWSIVAFWSYSFYNSELSVFKPLWHWGGYLIVYSCFFWELMRYPLGKHLQKPDFFSR